jgi:hypothetical protein
MALVALFGLGLPGPLLAAEGALQAQPRYYWDADFGVSTVNVDAGPHAVGDLFSIGYQVSDLFGVEAGVMDGPQGDYRGGNKGGFDWETAGFTVMPTLRRWSLGPGARAYDQTLGLRVGQSILAEQTAPASAYDGLDLGLVYRVQALFGPVFDLGLECSYDWAFYQEDGSPIRGIDGPSLRLVLGSWFGSPVKAVARAGAQM